MPIKLIPPKPGRSPNYYACGKYLGIFVDRTTATPELRVAKIQVKQWEQQIERGEYKDPRAKPVAPEKREPTFTDAALAYLNADGDPSYISKIIEHEGEFALRDVLVKDIDQVLIDNAAAAVYPNAPASTRNRSFYTPVCAVMRRAGNRTAIMRPVGWRGKKSQSWLEPEQAFPLIGNCYKLDQEFGLLCLTYLYTGVRLSDPLRSHLRDLKLDIRDRDGRPRPLLYIPDTKNGDPRPVHVPPFLVEAFRAQPARVANSSRWQRADVGVPFLERSPNAKLFRFHVGGDLRDMLAEAMRMTGLSFPRREGGFHIFCHTWGTWMRRYGSLDTPGLVRTGRWKDADSVERYVHTEASFEARQADLLPTPTHREYGAIVPLIRKA